MAAPPVISATAWSSRRLTTAGVAPMSLIETRTPASGWRAWKSLITACQIGPKPRAEVSTRTAQSLPSAGSSSTSRLPEPTTPTSTGAKAPAGRPPGKEKSRVSSPAGTSLIVESPATSF